MFSRTLLSVFLLLTTTGIFAQNKPFKLESDSYYVGPRVGAIYSNLTGMDGKFKLGANVGGFFEYMVTDNIGVEADLTYTHQGSRNAKALTKGQNYDFRLEYINTVFIGKYYVKPNIALEVGLHVGYLISASLNGNSDLKKSLKHSDVTFPIGVSYNYKQFIIDARYHFPLNTIVLKDDAEARSHMGSAKNTAFQLTVGYRFQIM